MTEHLFWFLFLIIAILFIGRLVLWGSYIKTYHVNAMRPANEKDAYIGDWIAEISIKREPLFFGERDLKYFQARGRGAVWRDAKTARLLDDHLESMLECRWIIERWHLSDDAYRPKP